MQAVGCARADSTRGAKAERMIVLTQALGTSERGVQLAPKRRRVDRRVAVQVGLDRVVERAYAQGLHEPSLEHAAHIVEILLKAALDLR